MTQPPKTKTNGGDSYRRALRGHRRLGILSALFVALLAVTGLVLNHAEDWKLDKTVLNSPWLLAHYGLAPKGDLKSVETEAGWATWVDGTLYVAGGSEPLDVLVGAVAQAGVIVVAGPEQLLVLTREGALVERIENHLLPAGATGLGRSEDGRIALRTNEGAYLSDPALAAWTPVGEHAVAWSAVVEPPDTVRDAVLQRYRGEGLPVERILLDIHTGRIFGAWGPLMMDAAAVLFLVLAISGIVTWRRSMAATKGDKSRRPPP